MESTARTPAGCMCCLPRRPKTTWIGASRAWRDSIGFWAASIDSLRAMSIATERGEPNEADRQALRKLHQTVRKITGDFDSRWHFNTSIAALMELGERAVRARRQAERRRRCDEILEKLTLMLAPFAPYTAQELWDAWACRSGVPEPWPALIRNWPKKIWRRLWSR